MADNVAITAGSGTSIAADDVSSVYFQKVKLDIGGDGVSSPVTSLALETGGNLDTISSDTTSIDGKITACNTGAVVISSALPAGTNGIGKLTANSGVDIGDVDVTSTTIDNSINGASAPTIDSYTTAAINLTTGANQVIQAAPGASKQIWIYGYGFTCGDADGQTVSFQDEDDTAVTGVMEFAQYGGINNPVSGNFAMPIHKLTTNKALEVDITGGDVDGWISYGVASV
jgi:hypothetical protein